MNFTLLPAQHLNGVVMVPGDKSISHRALMFGAIAEGQSVIKGLLRGEDVLGTMQALRMFGIKIQDSANEIRIHGKGMQALKTDQFLQVNLGNSGTSLRILSGLLCAQHVSVQLFGDQYLNKRPMGRVVEPLKEMGANIKSHEGCPPILIKPLNHVTLKPIEYQMPIASAQVKSAILMAALYAHGKSVITSPDPCRDHTEHMLEAFGYPIEFNQTRAALHGCKHLISPGVVEVPSDLSSAAFLIVGALLKKEAKINLLNVGVNETRIGILVLLERMGANVVLKNRRFFGTEPVADIEASYSKLRGIVIEKNDVALAIDEIPILLIAAACAEGVTVLKGASELRVKESDRLMAMCQGLVKLGIQLDETEDGAVIHGGSFVVPSDQIDSFGDHRIAMSFAMASLLVPGRFVISDCQNVHTSFPNFVDHCQALGMLISADPN